MAPKFAYWDLRGLGQAIRFILEYTGEAYDERVYCLKQLPDGSVDREDWLKEKFTLGLDFPNLPYYIDGDLKLTQSRAILDHIGNKHGLSGSNNQEKAMISMLESEAYDYRVGFAMLCYDEKFEEKKSGYLEGLKPKLEILSKFLGNKEFLMGKITTADFMMYESLYCINKLCSALIDSHKNLKDYLTRFAALPKIKEYLASKKYIGSPMNAPTAKFGGQKE